MPTITSGATIPRRTSRDVVSATRQVLPANARAGSKRFWPSLRYSTGKRPAERPRAPGDKKTVICRLTPRYRLEMSWVKNIRRRSVRRRSSNRRDPHRDTYVPGIAAARHLQVRDDLPRSPIVDAIDADAVDGIAGRVASIAQLGAGERILDPRAEVL